MAPIEVALSPSRPEVDYRPASASLRHLKEEHRLRPEREVVEHGRHARVGARDLPHQFEGVFRRDDVAV